MESLNNINWDDISLYHGTNNIYLNSILKNGFFIPTHENNWLGKGTYFAVNNVFMPILYSNNHVNNYNSKKDNNTPKAVPAILEIKGKYLSDEIKNKVLDLTVQNGINLFHNISAEFSNFIKPYEDNLSQQEKFDVFEKHFSYSPFYNDALKPNLIPNLEWLAFAISTNTSIKTFNNQQDLRLEQLEKITDSNISNMIFAWFNYKYSCGMEKDIPIRGIMAHFSTGTPISLSKVLKGTKLNRGFADYISYLNRTELSIFGYNYYENNQNKFWDFKKLFCEQPVKDTHYLVHLDKRPIIGLLNDSFTSSKKLGFEMSGLDIENLYKLLITEHDTN